MLANVGRDGRQLRVYHRIQLQVQRLLVLDRTVVEQQAEGNVLHLPAHHQRVALAFTLLGHVGGARLLRLCQLVEHRAVKVLVQRVQIGRVDAAPHDLVAVQEDAVLDRRERGLDHVDKVLYPQKE
uniref:Uncharacterized protein n=1 Tax=Anopheles quadriannulatus TaxID=34691 RepID=A0A182XRS9_ANOQN